MSYKSKDSDQWSRAPEALLRAARGDHAPSAADRARVRSALARAIAAGPSATTTTSDATASNAPQLSSAGNQVAVRNLVKVGLGVALVISGAFVYMRAGQSSKSGAAPALHGGVASDSGAAPALRGGAASEGADSPARATQPLASPLIEQHPLTPPTTLAPSMPAVPSGSPAREATASSEGAAHNAWQSRGQRRGRELRPVAVARAPALGSTAAARATRAALDTETRPPANESTPEILPSSETERPSESTPASQQRAAEQAARIDTAPTVPARPPLADLPSEAREADGPDARAELVFLQRIQSAMLDSDTTRVLALCSEHERRWPRGTFVQEREGLRAIASCEADATDARARASTFVARYPHSPLAPRVRAGCAPLLVPQHRTLPASPQ